MDLTSLMNSLETHYGTITAIATIILVSVTAGLVLATIQLSEVTKKMWLAQDRPLLKFYVKKKYDNPDIPILDLYVKNIGKGPALDIFFNIYLKDKYEPLIQTISLLAIGEMTNIIKLTASGEVDIEDLVYHDINNQELEQEVDILNYDFYALSHIPHINFD